MPKNKKYTREILISEEAIYHRLDEIALEIAAKYQNKNLLLVGVLNGAFIVMADLGRALFRAGLTDVEVDFVQVSSYGSGTESSKNPRFLKDCSVDVQGRHVLFVEDIIDSGHTLAALRDIFAARGTASIATFSLLNKPSRREADVPVEYIGFEVDAWIDGCGLDTDQLGRLNPNITKVHEI